MTLNHNKTVGSLLCVSFLVYSMHSRDTIVLIDLLLCTTPACFGTFFQSTMVLTLVENSKFFSALVC